MGSADTLPPKNVLLALFSIKIIASEKSFWLPFLKGSSELRESGVEELLVITQCDFTSKISQRLPHQIQIKEMILIKHHTDPVMIGKLKWLPDHY